MDNIDWRAQRLAAAYALQAADQIAAANGIPSALPRLRDLTDARRKNEFSLSRMIGTLAAGDRPRGAEAELADEAARTAGSLFAESSATPIPLAALTRDLAVAGDGGYLAPTDVGQPRDLLQHFSVLARSGATILRDVPHAVTAPRLTTDPVAYWLASESTQITESSPVIGQIALAPKLVGCYVEISRQLLKQGPQADPFLRRILSRVVAKAIDAAMIAGSGSSGEPQGIIGTSGVGTEAGASFAWSNAQSILETLASADVADEDVAFIGAPDARETLAQVDVGTATGIFVWNGDTIAGRPARVSSVAPSASMVVGDFAQCVCALFGSVAVETNPVANFAAGITGLRLLVAFDCAVIRPSAFVTVESIS